MAPSKWTTAPSTKASGTKKVEGKTEELRFGKMAANTQGIGITLWPMVAAGLSTQMETSTKASGATTRRTAEVRMNTLTEQSTSGTGKKTASTAMASNHGRTTPGTKATMNTEKNTESAISSGLMALRTLENFIITIFMGKEFTPGKTVVVTQANGKATKCTEKGPFRGLMAENTSANTPKTKSAATENSFGLTAGAIEENG